MDGGQMGLIKPNTVKKHRMMNITGRVPLTLYRSTGGEVVDWEWKDNVRIDVEIEANIQPFKPHEVYQMPEALRTKEWIKLYSESEIKGLEEGDNATLPDEFEWQGKRYMVDKVSFYKMGVLDHYKAIAYRIRTTAK